MIQSQNQSDPINFEVHMYHPTEMADAITTTSWFYTFYVHTPLSQIQRDNPSRLEIAFFLDSGASILVFNYPTYIPLTKLLDIRPNQASDIGPNRPSKTLTVANQTEVSILHYGNIIEDSSRYVTVPFAVADIKYNILGTPFFEDNIQNINIQDFSLEFKYLSKVHPNYVKFTSLSSKDYPYFSYIYRINSKTQIRLKPKEKLFWPSIYNYTTKPLLSYNTTHYKVVQLSISLTFLQIKKPGICAIIIQNISKHVATLPTRHIGYIEVPIINEKSKFYQVNDINILIHNVCHTYHPEITEQAPQTNCTVHYDDPTTHPSQFSLHQI